jgi:hypothetical protein
MTGTPVNDTKGLSRNLLCHLFTASQTNRVDLSLSTLVKQVTASPVFISEYLIQTALELDHESSQPD